MADIRDGSVNDQALREILVIEGSGQFFDIRHPESFSSDTEFIYVFPQSIEGTSITVQQIIDANFDNNLTSIKTGEVISNFSDKCILSIQDNKYVLLTQHEVKKSVSLPVEEITLTVDEYSKTLNSILHTLEELRHYINIKNKLHQEAVQDAVDIVQTKRIDFTDTKNQQVDVTGIFIAVAISIFFEAGIAVAFASSVAKTASGATSAITKKLSSLKGFKIGLDFIFRVIGRSSSNSPTAAIELAKKNIAAARAELRKLNDLEDDALRLIKRLPATKAGQRIFNQELSKIKSERSRSTPLLLQIKKEADFVEASEKELRSELSKIGKKRIDDSIEMFGGTKESLSKSVNLKGIAKDTTNATASRIKKTNSDPSIVPLDIYYKSEIQNYFKDELSLVEEYILIVKKMLYSLSFPITDRTIETQNKIIELLNLFSLQRSLEIYESEYGIESFNQTLAKDIQTKEYEFIIWTLYLFNKIHPKIRNALLLHLAASRGFQPSPKLINEQIIPNLDLSDDFKEYLLKRFSIDNVRLLIDEIKKTMSIFQNSINEINDGFIENESERYKVNIIVKSN